MFANIVNINNQTAQLLKEAQAAASNFDLGFFFLRLPILLASSGMTVAANVASVFTQMTTVVATATVQIPICGANVAASIGQQLNTILANVQNCTQSG
jgi:hypothetical protein